MNLKEHSIYPHLKKVSNQKALKAYFTPSADEISFARENCRQKLPRIALLLWIKVVGYLRYFPAVNDIPYKIISHVALSAGTDTITKKALSQYEKSGTRKRHGTLVRQFLGLKKFDSTAKTDVYGQCLQYASTKTHLTDITNAAIEYLISNQFELPALSTLEKLAREARKNVNTTTFESVSSQCDEKLLQDLERLLISDSPNDNWLYLKSAPKTASPRNADMHLNYADWLFKWQGLPDLSHLPVTRLQQFREEAFAMTVNHIRREAHDKTVTLMITLIFTQQRITLDHITQIFNRIMAKISKEAQQQLEKHYTQSRPSTDAMIRRFKKLLIDCHDMPSALDRLSSPEDISEYLGNDLALWLELCQSHLDYADRNDMPFLIKAYRNKRRLLIRCTQTLPLATHSPDHQWLLDGLDRLVMDYQKLKAKRTSIDHHWQDIIEHLPRKWRDCIHDTLDEDTVCALHLELGLLQQLHKAIYSRAIHVQGAQIYDDHRSRLVDSQTFNNEINDYMEHVGLPAKPSGLIKLLQSNLSHWVDLVDKRYTESASFTIVNGILKLAKPPTKKPTASAQRLRSLIESRFKPISILDLIVDVDNLLDISRFFTPISGHQHKVKDHKKRFAATLLCYGCNFGPNQTANSLKAFSRKQVAWLNLRKVNVDKLQKAINCVVNTYDKMSLPKQWGNGKHASADGTHWKTYEQNLIVDFHFRYCLKGAIGYYIVSDKYIALFSHFISCGVYEATYILDGVMSNESTIRPDTLHGDTHAQSSVVFGLCYLLGIKLMPRIRNIKGLSFYHPTQKSTSENISDLFKQPVRWELIEKGLPEMMQIALSIHKGLVTPSSILQMLGEKSKNSPLYQAFRELGRVVRTQYLLEYLHDVQLRQMVNAQTVKSESYNDYLKWIFFYNNGVIADNLQYTQEKIIKYAHLLSNMAIFYNANEMTRILEELKQEGHSFTAEDVGHLSPFRKGINRTGYFHLDVSRKAMPLHSGEALFEEEQKIEE